MLSKLKSSPSPNKNAVWPEAKRDKVLGTKTARHLPHAREIATLDALTNRYCGFIA